MQWWPGIKGKSLLNNKKKEGRSYMSVYCVYISYTLEIHGMNEKRTVVLESK